jgi:cysteine desulfurase
MGEIYLDNAASTPIDPQVLKTLNYAQQHLFGNPSNIKHQHGKAAKKALEDARINVGTLLGLDPRGVIFTSGATEANNLALRGITCLQKGRCAAFLSSIEHACVMESAKFLINRGVDVKLIPVKSNGQVDIDVLAEMIRKTSKIKLVSVMLVNNETGVIQPIGEVIRRARWRGALVHVDAVQGIGKMNIDILKEADMCSISGHKINGPKGVGCLWVRPGLKISPLLVGGGQEFGIRSGTTPVPLIIGFAKALEIAIKHQGWVNRINPSMRILESTIAQKIPGATINGKQAPRVGNITNISFPFKKDVIQFITGVAVSSGAACGCSKNQPSRVLLSMGVSDNMAKNSIRVSAGKFNTAQDIQMATKLILQAANLAQQ